MAQWLRMTRNHGSRKKYFHEFLGVSSRLDAIQTAVLLAKLRRLNVWNKKRQAIARLYSAALKTVKNIATPIIAKGNRHVFHQYTIRVRERDELRQHLKQKGIETSVHYPLPLHLQPAFKYLGYKKGDFPEAEKVAQEVLSLPIYPELMRPEIHFIVKRVLDFLRAKS